MNYKKAYEMLRDEIINIVPYCDNCKYDNYTPKEFDPCENCHRKYMEWIYDPARIINIEEICNE